MANLHEQNPETVGYTLADHLDAVLRHGVTVDVVLAQKRGAVAMGDVHCPVVEFGLVNATIHQIDERVPLADLATLTAIYESFIAGYFASATG